MTPAAYKIGGTVIGGLLGGLFAGKGPKGLEALYITASVAGGALSGFLLGNGLSSALNPPVAVPAVAATPGTATTTQSTTPGT